MLRQLGLAHVRIARGGEHQKNHARLLYDLISRWRHSPLITTWPGPRGRRPSDFRWNVERRVVLRYPVHDTMREIHFNRRHMDGADYTKGLRRLRGLGGVPSLPDAAPKQSFQSSCSRRMRKKNAFLQRWSLLVWSLRLAPQRETLPVRMLRLASQL